MATGGCEDISDKCTPCAKTNKNTESVKYCVECRGYCCQTCVDLHNVFPALEGHQLLDKSDFKATGITSDLPTERCKIHTVKVVDMYCGNHDVVGCTSCMALTHRSCADVQMIPDVINTIFKKADADKTIITLQDKIKHLEKIVNTRMALLKELKKSKIEATTAILHFREEMELLLKSLEKESVNQVEEEYHKKESMLEEEKKKAENEIENIKEADNGIRQQALNKLQTFVKIKIAQEKAISADGVISSLQVPSDAKITFEVDTGVKDSLCQLQSLGKIAVRYSTVYEPKTSVYSIKCNSDINIRLPNDETSCHLVGSCSTENGMILFIDISRQILKRTYVSNMSIIDQCSLLATPHCVCTTSKQEAAVATKKKTIQFVSLGNRLKPTRQITLSHSCTGGIAYKDNKFYTIDSRSSLYIDDMEGNMLRTVLQDSLGNPLLKSSGDIAISDNGENLFVVDRRNTVTVLDIQGNYIDTFTDSDLTDASYICTDNSGNVFVCGKGSNNIIQIGQDGRKKGVIAIAPDGIANPTSICFDPKSCILFVTQSNSNTVKLLYLK